MRKATIIIFLGAMSLDLYAPPNCEIYRNDEACYESCQKAMTAIRFRQGSFESQKHFKKSIELCPSFAYSYMEKAVPFLKRGKFIQWKKMIDKAVEIDPKNYLGYRAWCRLQFLRDYEGTIKDIEKLKTITNYDIGYCQTGDYHLNVALALCYKELGQLEKAKKIIESHINSKDTWTGAYDYYHLGIIEYNLKNYDKALFHFKKQIEVNDYMGETCYFIALVFKKLEQKENYSSYLKKAKEYYVNGKYRTDTYVEMIDKIFLSDIEEEIKKNTQYQ